jgi:hypothetical protein
MKKIQITTYELLLLSISLILTGVIMGNNQLITDKLVYFFVLFSIIQLPLFILIRVIRRSKA